MVFLISSSPSHQRSLMRKHGVKGNWTGMAKMDASVLGELVR